MCFVALPALVLGLRGWAGEAGLPAGTAKDKDAIRKNAHDFVKAFHNGDAKAVAAFFTADGDYTEHTGRNLKGREAIEKAFKRFFAEHKGAKVRIESLTLRFVTPNVAIEDGASAVFLPEGGPPSRVRYTNVHVKKDGKWLLSSVRDTLYSPPTNYSHLRGLEWLLGDWASDAGKTGKVERASFGWAENQNFITGALFVTSKDLPLSHMTLWVGWDPAGKRVRSWSFDSTGGFGEGSWAREGKKWVVKSTSTHRDGKRGTATFVLTPVDADTISLEARDRSLGGEALPPKAAVRLKRVK
jgi:uncharacterized protein (TIGR02246 family)